MFGTDRAHGFRPLRRWSGVAVLALAAIVLAACTPTVQVAAPQEPITVNLNVKIQHEIYVKVDREVDSLFSDSGLF